MIAEEKIRKAMKQSALDFITSNATINGETGQPVLSSSAVAWGNRKFDPSDQSSKQWTMVTILETGVIPRGIGHGGQDEYTAIIQVDVNVPLNEGEGDLEKWYRKARLFYAPGNHFVESGQVITVTACEGSTNRQVENHYRKSISVSIRSDLKRHNPNI